MTCCQFEISVFSGGSYHWIFYVALSHWKNVGSVVLIFAVSKQLDNQKYSFTLNKNPIKFLTLRRGPFFLIFPDIFFWTVWEIIMQYFGHNLTKTSSQGTRKKLSSLDFAEGYPVVSCKISFYRRVCKRLSYKIHLIGIYHLILFF